MDAVAQGNHALDALLGCGVQIRTHHDAAFPVIHFAVHNGKAVVLHIRIGGDRVADHLAFTKIRQLRFGVAAADIFDGVFKLIGQLQRLDGLHGKVLTPILCAL